MSKLLKSLASLIRGLRAQKDISQLHLAQNLGIHPNTIGHIERADRWPSIENLVKIAVELEEEPGALLQHAYEDSLKEKWKK